MVLEFAADVGDRGDVVLGPGQHERALDRGDDQCGQPPGLGLGGTVACLAIGSLLSLKRVLTLDPAVVFKS